MKEIESICGGHFIFYGGGRVTFIRNNIEYSANVIAGGFRKLGVLARLLETSAINPSISDPLFWDEPDLNLNPILMKPLVAILLDISRIGQQIVLTTHDYAIVRWFDLLMNEQKRDHIRFHSLIQDSQTSEINIFSINNYLPTEPNPIDRAYGLMLEHKIEKDMGRLGR